MIGLDNQCELHSQIQNLIFNLNGKLFAFVPFHVYSCHFATFCDSANGSASLGIRICASRLLLINERELITFWQQDDAAKTQCCKHGLLFSLNGIHNTISLLFIIWFECDCFPHGWVHDLWIGLVPNFAIVINLYCKMKTVKFTSISYAIVVDWMESGFVSRLPIRIVRIDYKNHSSKMPLQNWKIYCAYFIDRSGWLVNYSLNYTRSADINDVTIWLDDATIWWRTRKEIAAHITNANACPCLYSNELVLFYVFQFSYVFVAFGPRVKRWPIVVCTTDVGCRPPNRMVLIEPSHAEQ